MQMNLLVAKLTVLAQIRTVHDQLPTLYWHFA